MRLLLILLGLAVVLVLAWWFAPREPVDVRVDPVVLSDDLDGYLAAREATVPDLKPEAAKTILWAGASGARTDIAIVYLHGFSATSAEIRPVPNAVAEALGANLYFARLAGHGRDGAAMAEPVAGNWVADLAEAMAIGRQLGDRVVVMGTSTGGTLAGMLAADPALADLREGLAGVIFVSPNFRLANPMARLLSWPYARVWVPWVAGETRSFTPQNPGHARSWTTEYPTVATVPLQALIDRTAGLDFGAAAVPALFWFSPDDAVVDARVTETVAAAWGGPVEVVRVEVEAGDDPARHVIAGDILSPAGTAPAIRAMGDWIAGL
ncbi:MAG: alpha/beta fold hydrolase [Pseudomonadota bacterium]